MNTYFYIITIQANTGKLPDFKLTITVTERVDRKDEEEVYHRARYLAVSTWQQNNKFSNCADFSVISFSCFKLKGK